MDKEKRAELSQLLEDMKKDKSEAMECLIKSRNELDRTNSMIKEYNDLTGSKNELVKLFDKDLETFETIMINRELYFRNVLSMADILKEIEDRIQNCERLLKEG